MPRWETLTCSLKASGNTWACVPLQAGDVSSQASDDSEVVETSYVIPSVLLDYLLLPSQITVNF